MRGVSSGTIYHVPHEALCLAGGSTGGSLRLKKGSSGNMRHTCLPHEALALLAAAAFLVAFQATTSGLCLCVCVCARARV